MEGSLQNVALTELPDTIGAPPSARLIESVERHGIIQPVLVAEDTDEAGEIHLVIVDGNRRVAASREAGRTFIPAFVLSGLSSEEIAQWTLVANGFRTSNYLTEFGAIRLLQGNRYTPNDIRKISGMAGASIDLRNQLSDLNRELFTALQHGRIGQAEAIAAAKLHRDDQELLAERYRERGKLTRADIREIAPPEEADGEQTPQPSLHDDLRSAIQAARDLELSREQFLQLASKLWDAEG